MKPLAVIAGLLLFAAALPRAEAQDRADKFAMKAQAAFQARNYDTAIECWNVVLNIHPDDASAHFNRAAAYAEQRNEGGLRELDLIIADMMTLADYTDAIRLNPKDEEAYECRAKFYWDAVGDSEKAIADYSEAIRLKPDADLYLARGYIYSIYKEWDKAIADYSMAIALDPKNPSETAYVRRGDIYRAREEWDKALADYDNALRPSEYNYDALRGRTEVYLHRGDLDKALADADDLVRMNDKYPDSLRLRGRVYSARGEYDKAMKDFEQLIAGNPVGYQEWETAAWLYATCPKAEFRNGAKAIELALKACEQIQWHDAPCLDALAAAEAETGKWDDAIKHEKEAVDDATARKKSERIIKDYASRIPLYEQKKPFRGERQEE